jgi:O-antigen/teichoic acid export membrane protein
MNVPSDEFMAPQMDAPPCDVEETAVAAEFAANGSSAAVIRVGPGHGHVSLRKVLAVYAGGNTVAMGVQMLAGFLSTRLVDPQVLGHFNSFTLVVGYLPILGLGVFEGFEREMPYWLGKNDRQRVELLPGIVQAWALLLGSICAAVLLALAGWSALQSDWASTFGWSATAVLAFVTFFSNYYLETLFRTRHQFTQLSKVLILRSCANLVLVLGVWWFQFYGLCVRNVGSVLAGVTTLWRWRPIKAPSRLVFREIGQLIRVGAPIMAVTQISNLWFLMTPTLVLALMGKRALGLYSLYPMMLPALMLVPGAVGSVLYPRITESHGRGGGIGELVRYAGRPLLLLTIGMAPVVAVIWILLPQIVQILLPRYVEGVSAARWALLDVFVLCLMQARIIFFATGRQTLYLAGILAGVVINAAVLLWLIRDTIYLEAFSQAMVAGRLSYIMICMVILLVLWRREATTKGGIASN